MVDVPFPGMRGNGGIIRAPQARVETSPVPPGKPVLNSLPFSARLGGMIPEITLGSLHLSSYWLFYHLGFLGALFYGGWAAVHRENIPALEAACFFALLYFVQIPGGSILFAFEYWRDSGIIPFHLNPWKSGRSFHFVLASSLLLLFLYFRLTGRWRTRFLDHFAIAAAIMSPVQRIGCFLAGCCSGRPCRLPWAVTFPGSDIPVHPAQLYHIFFEGLFLLPCLLLTVRRRRFEGQVLITYILIYSVFRLAVETVRDNPSFLWGLSFAQVISGPAALLAALVWVHQIKKNRRNQEENSPVSEL